MEGLKRERDTSRTPEGQAAEEEQDVDTAGANPRKASKRSATAAMAPKEVWGVDASDAKKGGKASKELAEFSCE